MTAASFVQYLFTLYLYNEVVVHCILYILVYPQTSRDSHNRVSNTLAKKREPSKYNTMKTRDGSGNVFHTLVPR